MFDIFRPSSVILVTFCCYGHAVLLYAMKHTAAPSKDLLSSHFHSEFMIMGFSFETSLMSITLPLSGKYDFRTSDVIYNSPFNALIHIKCTAFVFWKSLPVFRFGWTISEKKGSKF